MSNLSLATESGYGSTTDSGLDEKAEVQGG